MQDNTIQVAGFEGGELRLLDPSLGEREAVLALPLTRMIAKMVRVEKDSDPVAAALPILKAMCPYPDDDLAVSCEKVHETERDAVYIAAALPESAADDIAEALDAAKLNIVRIDSLAIGELRGSWDRVNTADGGRRLVRIKSPDCITMFVLDGDHPVALRSVVEDTELDRMLLMMEAEDFAGPAELVEMVELESSPAALAGVRDRSSEPGTLDVLPASWREVLGETRFKAKLVKNLAIAGIFWALVMGVLFGVPVVYGFMTDYQKGLSKEHSKAYKAVEDMKKRTEVVQKYSDHARGALEILKAVSDRLPEAITLGSWDFERGAGVRFRGESDDSKSVYDFKDAMADLTAGGSEEDGTVPELIFPSVKLGALNERKGKQSFDLELKHEEVEE